MKVDNNVIFTMLDGSSKEQEKSTERFLRMLTEEEIKESMSDEFNYLDEDD